MIKLDHCWSSIPNPSNSQMHLEKTKLIWLLAKSLILGTTAGVFLTFTLYIIHFLQFSTKHLQAIIFKGHCSCSTSTFLIKKNTETVLKVTWWTKIWYLILYLQAITALAAPHVESFNFFLGDGLRALINCLPPLEFSLPNNQRISLRISVSIVYFFALSKYVVIELILLVMVLCEQLESNLEWKVLYDIRISLSWKLA